MSDRSEEDSFFEELAAESTPSTTTPAPDRLKQQILSALTDAMEEDRIFENLAAEVPALAAPPRLKSRIYSALVSAQAESGPLLGLGQCKESGRALCVFEEIVRIAPVGQVAQSINYCRVCHARVLAERMEHAPIYWPGCPYSDFQNH
jgi:hypothetical protein